MTDRPWWRHSHQLAASPDSAWVDRCSAWLQRPRGDLGPAAWLVLLQPDHHDPELRLPDGTLHTASFLEWAGPATGEPFEVVIEPAWADRRGEWTELAIDVRARRRTDELACCRGIYRLPGAHETFGARDLPPLPPEPAMTAQRVHLTLDEGQVQAFASVANTGHRIHDDPGYAHQQGFPGVVVQGPLLAVTVMHHAQPDESGAARFWYRRPVSAGTLLRLERAEPAVGWARWWITKPTGEVAVTGEVSASLSA